MSDDEKKQTLMINAGVVGGVVGTLMGTYIAVKQVAKNRPPSEHDIRHTALMQTLGEDRNTPKSDNTVAADFEKTFDVKESQQTDEFTRTALPITIAGSVGGGAVGATAGVALASLASRIRRRKENPLETETDASSNSGATLRR